jgi:hypothetical protein
MDGLHVPVVVTGIRKEDRSTVEVTAETPERHFTMGEEARSVRVEFYTELVGCPHIGDRLNVTIETTDH